MNTFFTDLARAAIFDVLRPIVDWLDEPRRVREELRRTEEAMRLLRESQECVQDMIERVRGLVEMAKANRVANEAGVEELKNLKAACLGAVAEEREKLAMTKGVAYCDKRAFAIRALDRVAARMKDL